MDHLWCITVKSVRHKDCRCQGRDRNTKVQRHLLHGAGYGACHACVAGPYVGMDQSVHTAVAVLH